MTAESDDRVACAGGGDSLETKEELFPFLDEYEEALRRGDQTPPDQWLNDHPTAPKELRPHLAFLYELHSHDAPVTSAPQWSPSAPPRIPGYEFFESLGRGGMGVVYKARQVSLGRTVAVKLIRDAHLASSDDVNRFRAEAAAAAQLRHANIVAIYEVGEHGGQQYFSMEYVQGTSLAALVRESPLPARQAADYVKLVAQAIHHAHTQGVLHRDLKPSNVLLAARSEHAVLQCGGLPLSTEETKESTSHQTPKHADESADYEPKVTDFGLAKRIEGGLDLTGTGQVLGTPSYMPPEQALGKHSEIRPWSDVYSLGAILYETLTCRPPFRAETPIATLEQVCGMDPVSPRLLNPTVPRDLETITLKCLEKDPKQRYQTAEDIVADLRRFLHDEPITARPVGKLERAVKWARRKPAIAGLAAAVLAAFLMGGVGVTWQWRRAERNLQETYETLLQLANSHFEKAVMTSDLGTKRAAVEDYEKAIAIQQRLLGQRPNDPKLFEQLAGSYHNLGNLQSSLGELDAALTSLQGSLKLRERMIREHPTRSKAERNLAVCVGAIGKVHHEAGRLDEAKKCYTEVRDKLEMHVGQHTDDTESQGTLAGTHRNLGNVLHDMGNFEGAIKAQRRAVEILELLIRKEPENVDHRDDLAQTLNSLAVSLKTLNHFDEAESAYGTAQATLKELVDKHPTVRSFQNALAMIHNNTALLLERMGKPEGAIVEYRHAIELRERLCRQDPTDRTYQSGLAHNLVMLASLQEDIGQTDDALQGCERAKDLLDRVTRSGLYVPEFQSRLSAAYAEIGEMYQKMGRLDEASEPYETAIRISERLMKDVPGDIGFAVTLAAQLGNHGHLLRHLGQREAALAEYTKAGDIQENLVRNHSQVQRYRSELSTTFESIGNLLIDDDRPGGWKAYRRCTELREEMARANPKDPRCQRDLASIYHNMGLASESPIEAVQYHEQARALRKELVASHPDNVEYHVELGSSINCIGSVLRRQGRVDEALAAFSEADHHLQLSFDRAPEISKHRAWLRINLQEMAGLLSEMDRFTEALGAWDRAIERAGPESTARLRFDRAYALARSGQHSEATAEVEQTLPQFPASPVDIYNAACVYAVAAGAARGDEQNLSDQRETLVNQYAVRAVELLRKAFSEGFNDLVQLKKDGDLNPLRSRHDFKELVAALEKNAATDETLMRPK